ncbi:MAG: dienelactone hydrolase family protein [Pseudomonadales bacterium]|nr:dienelactone hydrolase family protein [Pseudomonadales bacterium]
MIQRELDIQTEDGLMNTFITYPDSDRLYPVIVFYMDAPGKREELHDMATRLGSAGYYVVLPNLYYRKDRDFVRDPSSQGREYMFELMNSLTCEMVDRDTQAILDFVQGEERASAGPMGCVGYCMSGPFVFSAASTFSPRMQASASFHGIRLITDDAKSPHLRAGGIDGEIYFGCAEHDDWAPPEMIRSLESHLDDESVDWRVEWYPGTKHGFVFPLRGQDIYHKVSAERHWERLMDLFERRLKR